MSFLCQTYTMKIAVIPESAVYTVLSKYQGLFYNFILFNLENSKEDS